MRLANLGVDEVEQRLRPKVVPDTFTYGVDEDRNDHGPVSNDELGGRCDVSDHLLDVDGMS